MKRKIRTALGAIALPLTSWFGMPSIAAPILLSTPPDYVQTTGSVAANALLVAGQTGATAAGTVSGLGTVLSIVTLPSQQLADVRVAGNPSSTNATGTLSVLAGGQLIIDGTPDVTATGVFPGINTSRNPTNSATITVDGLGSNILLKGNSGLINLAGSSASDNGTATLSVTNGGVISGGVGANDFIGMNVGGGTATAGNGSLLISGPGSRVSITGVQGVGATTPGAAGGVLIGRGTGTGSATVSSGGALIVDSTGHAATASPFITIGRDAGSSGSLSISGTGSEVALTGDTINPVVNVGRAGTGTLSISGGGVLRLNGNGVALQSNFNSTNLNVGGAAGLSTGGIGTAVVSGAGSRIEMNGTNGFITVGRSTGANGSLTVQNGASVGSPVAVLVGIDGGTGSITLNNGSMNLGGIQQFGSAPNTGPAFVIGRNGGTGTVSMSNGASLTLSAPVTPNAFTAVSLGGTSVSTGGGTGTLNMSGGSTLTMTGAGPNSGLYVGRIGTGNMTVNGIGTIVDVSGVSDGGRVLVGVEPFGVNTGTGALIVANNGLVNAGALLGVAHNGVTSSGGTGTLILNSGGTVRATTIYVGNQGVIAGNGGSLVGNVISNQGFISPGLSPGQLTIEGGYATQGSGKFLLEIQSNGSGGFNVDSVLFRNITPGMLSFAGTEFDFSFLGDTDPLAFMNSAFDTLDSFFLFDNGGGAQGISHLSALSSLFNGVTFTARSDSYRINGFAFTADGGFTSLDVARIPEPGTLALVTLAALGLGGLRRRSARGDD